MPAKAALTADAVMAIKAGAAKGAAAAAVADADADAVVAEVDVTERINER